MRVTASIAKIEGINPAIAARMRLKLEFGLSDREMLLLNLDNAYRGDYLEVKTSDTSRYKRRLIAIETTDQLAAWKMASDLMKYPHVVQRDLQGAFRNRYRRYQSLCFRYTIDSGASDG